MTCTTMRNCQETIWIQAWYNGPVLDVRSEGVAVPPRLLYDDCIRIDAEAARGIGLVMDTFTTVSGGCGGGWIEEEYVLPTVVTLRVDS